MDPGQLYDDSLYSSNCQLIFVNLKIRYIAHLLKLNFYDVKIDYNGSRSSIFCCK